MRDQLIPSPVYTSFIHPLLLFVILTSSSSSSSSSPSLLPPFQRANPIPVGRSGHDFITRRDLAAEDHSSPLRARRARSLAGPFFKSHSAPPPPPSRGRNTAVNHVIPHSFIPVPDASIHTEECSTNSIVAKGFVCPPTRCLSDGITSPSYSSSSRCPILIKLPTMTFRVPL